ncbi:hypothetical protein PAXINDRAFT_9021 [Paxillus involutus ATCC 200175]|nr:hypothetical protein PAXINDRAFT_9021 [Paxillus involutus ATCC 200175]
MPTTTCDSLVTLKAEIDAARKKVSLEETEDTWDTIAQGVMQLTVLCNNGGCEFPSDIVAGMRSLSRRLSSAMNSERSKLSGGAIELLTALAAGLGSLFEPLVSLLIPGLLALCGRSNKVFAARARGCMLAVVEHTQLPSLLPYLAELGTHKSVFPRLTAAEGVLACLNCFNPPDLEKDSRARIVEDFIKLTARDASADVRHASKKIFEAYKTLMPGRVESFVAPLTPVVKKYLDIQGGTSRSKQISRPPRRASPKVTHDTKLRHARIPSSNTLDHPPTRVQPPQKQSKPVANGPRRGLRDSQLVTSSRAPHDSQPRRLLHHDGKSSGAPTAQMSAHHAAIQRPPPGSARVVPLPSTSVARGPQRPTAMQIKTNPPFHRDQVLDAVRSVRGARRVPLTAGVAGEQMPPAAAFIDKADKVNPLKFPSRGAEVPPLKRSITVRKAPEVTRPTLNSSKQAKALTTAQRSRIAMGNRNKPVSQQRPVMDVPKEAMGPPAKGPRKEVEASPDLVPSPPKRSPQLRYLYHYLRSALRNMAILQFRINQLCLPSPSLPIKLDCETQRRLLLSHVSTLNHLLKHLSLLSSSIQQGFLFTPSSPLSPPQTYLPAVGVFSSQVKTGDVLPDTPFRRSLEQDFMNTLDSNKLKAINLY